MIVSEKKMVKEILFLEDLLIKKVRLLLVGIGWGNGFYFLDFFMKRYSTKTTFVHKIQ
jgi:hypothetical protein